MKSLKVIWIMFKDTAPFIVILLLFTAFLTCMSVYKTLSYETTHTGIVLWIKWLVGILLSVGLAIGVIVVIKYWIQDSIRIMVQYDKGEASE